jgi:predicted porin
MVHYGEVHVTAQGVTDSGLKWRVRFEDSQDDADDDGKKVSTDETWVELTGSWGRLILGGQDGPGDVWHGASDLVYTGARDHSIFADIQGGNVQGADKTNMEDSSDATKIFYSTPRIAGFMFGYAIAPERESAGATFDNSTADGDGGPFHEASIDYRGKIGDGMLILNLKGSRKETLDPVTLAPDTNNAWGLSGNYTFGAFTVAAGYVDNDVRDGGDGARVVSSATAWDAGVAYNGGKWEASLSYLKQDTEDAATGVEDTYDQWVVSGVYNLGGGMTVAGSIYLFDVDAASAPDESTDGWAGVVKTTFRF